VRGSTHEALALGASYLATTQWLDDSPGIHVDPRALPLACLCIGVLALWEAIAWVSQMPQKRERKRWEKAQRQLGRSKIEVRAMRRAGMAPRVDWHGPPKAARWPLRLIALFSAFSVAIPVGVALASARLPDLLEVGKIPHRGPTHSLLTAAALTGVVAMFADEYALEVAAPIAFAFALSYVVAHIAADGLTLDGVPALWPFYRRDVHLLPAVLRVRSGSLVDSLIAFGVLAALVLVSAPPR
jgi:LexA-binding, inner membrane-associated putative hydrolase